MTRPTVYIIDFEAFKHGDEDYQLKELCIIDASCPMKQLHYTFLPPCKWEELSSEQKRTYTYLTREHHRLSWNEGYVRYCRECLRNDVARFIKSSHVHSSMFYVMGREKTRFLQSLFPDYRFMNYQEVHNVSMRDLPEAPDHIVCNYRNHGKHCAVLKCTRILLHFISLYF